MPSRVTSSRAADICTVRCLSPLVAEAKRELAPTETYRQVAELFGTLADPTRMTIIHALSQRELCTCDLAAIVGASESGVSQHLRILRALRVVNARRVGKFVYYTLDDVHVAEILRMGLDHQGRDGARAAAQASA